MKRDYRAMPMRSKVTIATTDREELGRASEAGFVAVESDLANTHMERFSHPLRHAATAQ